MPAPLVVGVDGDVDMELSFDIDVDTEILGLSLFADLTATIGAEFGVSASGGARW